LPLAQLAGLGRRLLLTQLPARFAAPREFGAFGVEADISSWALFDDLIENDLTDESGSLVDYLLCGVVNPADALKTRGTKGTRWAGLRRGFTSSWWTNWWIEREVKS
jgi:hypothetical protein